jgi:hypothetical protein
MWGFIILGLATLLAYFILRYRDKEKISYDTRSIPKSVFKKMRNPTRNISEEYDLIKGEKNITWTFIDKGIPKDCQHHDMIEKMYNKYKRLNKIYKFNIVIREKIYSVNFKRMYLKERDKRKIFFLKRKVYTYPLHRVMKPDIVKEMALEWFKLNPISPTKQEIKQLRDRKIVHICRQQDEDTIIFEMMKDWFSNAGLNVYKVNSIVTPHLHESYMMHNRRIDKEELLIHGTKTSNLQSIFKHGLKQVYSKQGLLGQGMYFTDNPKYSIDGKYYSKDVNYFRLLLFRVATGKSYNTSICMTDINLAPDGYDSVTMFVGQTKIWCVYNEQQIELVGEVWCGPL